MLDQQPARVPKVLRPTRIILFVQAVLSIVAGVFLIALISTFEASTGDGAGGWIVMAVIAIALGVIVLACAVLMPRRQPWIRPTILVIEILNAISALLGLLIGFATGGFTPALIVPLAFSILVIQALTKAEVRAWFDGADTLLP